MMLACYCLGAQAKGSLCFEGLFLGFFCYIGDLSLSLMVMYKVLAIHFLLRLPPEVKSWYINCLEHVIRTNDNI